MAITVAPGAREVLLDYGDGFVLQVQSCDDLEAALDALRTATQDLVAIGSGEVSVSAPVVAPEGPIVRVSGLDLDEERRLAVLDAVVKRLHDAGVSDAVVDVPEPGGELDALDGCANAVVLRIFPEPLGARGSIPPRWVDLAGEWVLGDQAPSDLAPIRVLGLEWRVPVAEAPSVLHHAAQSRAWCDLVKGNLRERVRSASLTFGGTPHLALAAGGPACDRAALLARFELLCEVAREVAAEAAYACVDFEPTFEDVGLGLSPDGWQADGGAAPNLVAGRLADLLVPDVYPYQVLGPSHLDRFVPGAHLDAPPIGTPIGGERIEVAIGEPEAWLPLYQGRAEVRRRGIEVLAPLLATPTEVDELLVSRPEGAAGAAPVGESALGLPDLRDIRLETLPHSRRGLRLTLLELVAWLAHEPHSDAPVSVSPVVATYARWFASALDDATRQTLKDRAARLIGTASPTPSEGGLSPADQARAWAATDWLMRVQAVGWLRAAGLVEAASRLEAVGPIRHHVELVRAVDVMSSALVIASRRIELTASVAASGHPVDADLVGEASWEAWEAASEGAGWVAASEAAGVGVPADLAYATDLRVIECARDPRVRAELEAAGRSIGDSAWAAAIRAVADSAWAAGWAAAHRAVDALAVVPLGTALDRAGRAASARAETEDPELALERAEVAAVDRLAQGALDRSEADGPHPWDAAREAAAAAEGGAYWTMIQDLARDAVDLGPWEAGMTAAREAVDRVLLGAPDLVARAVAAALAKETASAAARGIAGRATAVARAQGADPLAATDAAHDALGPIANRLQREALALLDVLVETGADERG
ncbi:MAG: hypothetical protein ACLGI8_15370 [Acidimicrobiia bacterium]